MRNAIGKAERLFSLVALLLVIAALVVARAGSVTSAGAGPTGSAGSVQSPGASIEVTAPALAVTHYQGADISFDYPSSWHPLPRKEMANSWIAAFTTGPVPASCCVNYVVPAGTMAVSIAYGSGSLNLAAGAVPGSVSLVVGKAKALFVSTSDKADRADVRLRWLIQRTPTGYFDVEALITGPGTADLRAQMEKFVASIVVA